MPAPPWLHDEPELVALFGAVLDRFDQKSGDERQQRTFLGAERYLCSLARGDAEADQLWRFVRTLENQAVYTVVLHKQRNPYDPEWKGARLAFAPESETILRAWLDRPREEPAIRAWRAAVEAQAAAFPGGIDELLRRRIAVPDHDDAEVVAALARIGTLDQPLTLRQLSARLFRGDSKRLDEREELVRTLFPAYPLQPRPVVIAVHLPARCEGVLFVENQDSYAAACHGHPKEASNLALVYAAGFRGAANRLRLRDGVLLHYAGPGVAQQPDFEAWWFDNAEPCGPLAFWGDLDLAGMAILAALRQRFGEVTAWELGYRPLLERLRRGYGHLLAAADKQGQADPGITGCPYADSDLLPAIRRYGGIDQESLP